MAPTKRRIRPSQLLAARRDEALALLGSFGASSVRGFGCIARGDDGEVSDLDLLADLWRTITLAKRIEIDQSLAENFECDVDLVKPDEVSSGIRDKRFAEA